MFAPCIFIFGWLKLDLVSPANSRIQNRQFAQVVDSTEDQIWM